MGNHWEHACKFANEFDEDNVEYCILNESSEENEDRQREPTELECIACGLRRLSNMKGVRDFKGELVLRAREIREN